MGAHTRPAEWAAGEAGRARFVRVLAPRRGGPQGGPGQGAWVKGLRIEDCTVGREGCAVGRLRPAPRPPADPGSPKEVWDEQHRLLFDDPLAWQTKTQSLIADDEQMAALNVMGRGIQSVVYMPAGIAIENLLKGQLIAQRQHRDAAGKFKLGTHDLHQLAADAGYTIGLRPAWDTPRRGRVQSRLLVRQTDTGATAISTLSANLHLLTSSLQALLVLIVVLIVVYTLRHYAFTLNRLFGAQRHPYIDIDVAEWPSVTVLVAAHNEESVIEGSLRCLMEVDYPSDRLAVIPMNDRSTDHTREIVDSLAAQFPGRIEPFHRSEGKPGKAAALKDAMKLVKSDVIVVFDADYVPSTGLIKQLVAPLFDPEVGATMGRVVPQNGGANLLTRLLDLERSGGYQVDQQARMNLRLVPQYGGTVGAVRVRALEAVGGWRDDVLAEDTDLTYRLLLAGWQTVYQNRAECYEEVPQSWPVRIRQIMRWTKGHNTAMYAYSHRLFASPYLGVAAKLDGLLLLGVYAMSPLLLLGWMVSITLSYLDRTALTDGALALFGLMLYSALGNFAAFFEIGAAVRLDGKRNRIRLLPLNQFGFLVSMVSISRATVNQWLDGLLSRELKWDKTVRYRKPGAPP